MILVNLKYRIDDMLAGNKEVSEKEAEKLLKLPFVTLVNKDLGVNSFSDEQLEDGYINNNETLENTPESKENNENSNENENFDENGFSELSDEEIRKLYEEKTGKKSGNKKIENLIKEL